MSYSDESAPAVNSQRKTSERTIVIWLVLAAVGSIGLMVFTLLL